MNNIKNIEDIREEQAQLAQQAAAIQQQAEELEQQAREAKIQAERLKREQARELARRQAELEWKRREEWLASVKRSVLANLPEGLADRAKASNVTLSFSVRDRRKPWDSEYVVLQVSETQSFKRRTFKVSGGGASKACIKFITEQCDEFDSAKKAKAAKHDYFAGTGINTCRHIREAQIYTGYRNSRDNFVRLIEIDRLPAHQMKQVVDLLNSFDEEGDS